MQNLLGGSTKPERPLHLLFRLLSTPGEDMCRRRPRKEVEEPEKLKPPHGGRGRGRSLCSALHPTHSLLSLSLSFSLTGKFRPPSFGPWGGNDDLKGHPPTDGRTDGRTDATHAATPPPSFLPSFQPYFRPLKELWCHRRTTHDMRRLKRRKDGSRRKV